MAEPAQHLVQEKGLSEHIDAAETKRSLQHVSHEDRATALRVAMFDDPGPAFGTRRMVFFNLACTLVCFTGLASGIDSGVISSVQSMKPFKQYWKVTPTDTSLIFGLLTLGTVAASLPALYVPDKIGRVKTMFLGSVILLAGALMSALTNHNFSLFLAGRFFTGLGAAFAGIGGRAFLAEFTPPTIRGRWLGIHNVFSHAGSIVATAIAIPFGYREDEWGWRATLIFQALPALVTLALVFFVPESPRWLYATGKTDRAIHVLAKYHSRDNDPQSPLVQIEIGEIEDIITLRRADPYSWWNPRPLFSSRALLIRFGMGIIPAVFQTVAGNGLPNYFLPTLLDISGIHNTNTQRILNMVNQITSTCSSAIGTSIIDVVGRRFLMLFSATSNMINMAILSGIESNIAATSRARAGIAFIFIFMAGHTFGWTPIISVYPTECFSYETRAKGLAYNNFIQSGLACINTFALPIAIARLEWKVFTLFVPINFVALCIIYVFAVETKGLSLEELDYVFAAKDPKKASFDLYENAKERAKFERSNGQV